MKMKCLIIAAIFLLSGCDDSKEPRDRVYGTDAMKIYAAKEANSPIYGKYQYWVTDGTGKGWSLVTDSKFEVGNYLQITKK